MKEQTEGTSNESCVPRRGLTTIESLKKSLGLLQNGQDGMSSDENTEDGFTQILQDEMIVDGKATMKVKIQKVPKQDKKNLRYIYPYAKLDESCVSYRGYPVDGGKSFKKNWQIQIVSPSVGRPPEALPQFPQQELLQCVGQEYVGVPGMTLGEKEVSYNSGEAFLAAGQEGPKSSYFYTAGFNAGSAVPLQKPFPESIYHSVVAGISMPVKVVSKESKL